MSAKLDRIGMEWKKARARREQWAAKEAELEAQYKEQENLEICEITHSYSFTPDQLAALFQMMEQNKLPENMPMQTETAPSQDAADNFTDEEDEFHEA